MKTLPATLMALVLTAALGVAQTTAAQTPPAQQKAGAADAQAWVQKHMTGWPQRAQKVAVQLVGKYGPPGGVTDREITWYGNGPWKRTVLHREEIQHNFPMPHKDILEQFVSYRVPTEKLAEIAQFNGSVVVHRTSGEMSVRCESEDMNILALNIADNIVTGNRSVQQALAYNAQALRGKMIGESDSYLQKLQFAIGTKTADPGDVAPLMRHMTGADAESE